MTAIFLMRKLKSFANTTWNIFSEADEEYYLKLTDHPDPCREPLEGNLHPMKSKYVFCRLEVM